VTEFGDEGGRCCASTSVVDTALSSIVSITHLALSIAFSAVSGDIDTYQRRRIKKLKQQARQRLLTTYLAGPRSNPLPHTDQMKAVVRVGPASASARRENYHQSLVHTGRFSQTPRLFQIQGARIGGPLPISAHVLGGYSGARVLAVSESATVVTNGLRRRG